jgi:hypothetical protein
MLNLNTVCRLGLIVSLIVSLAATNFIIILAGEQSYGDIGTYGSNTIRTLNIDHIVSLKDAYESGASSWGASKKKAFANDRSNHVSSCGRVNSSKGSEGPSDFLRRSRDEKGLEYEIVRFCEYVQKYYGVKVKYGLSLVSNDKKVFSRCGLSF